MKRHFYKLTAAFVAFMFLHFSVVAPVSGFSIGEEREIGEKLLYSVRRTFPLIDDPDLVQYINGLGRDVLQVAGLQYFDYRFYIINDKEFNAFSAPSGLIFFYSGLIGKMNSEDELVSVLAHEIGHVSKRHLAGRLEQGRWINVASVAMVLAALALGGGAATQAVMTGSLAAGKSAQLHFSRKDEEEADRLAYDWMKQLGRNPEGQKTMLETMRRVSRYRSEKPPQYLLTHPNPEARLDYVQALLSMEDKDQERSRDHDDFAFLRFKYRIMVQAEDAFSFREYMSSILSDGKRSEVVRAMAYYGLSQLEIEQKNYSEAMANLEKAMEMLPQQEVALQSDKGVLLYHMGRYLQAITLLESVIRQRPKDMYATFFLAKSYQIGGNIDRAQPLFRRVSYQLPEYAKVYFELGKIASLGGRNTEATFYLGKYHLLEGENNLARFSLKQVVDDEGADEKLKTEAERLLEVIDRLEE